ncbi:MAG: Asp-tRNA(Asn)/Glu-tRNA(Gln) amidotransferase subunit GatA [Deltaproteobacteria bacterium]|nr:Asp-tRNA(Asn)/Glu-tRNA(Gln) amidotransferase subunit GatA [Deltaproteobacteria bacterium]
MTLHELSLNQASELLQKREVSSVELTQAILDRIEKVESKIHAYITLTRESAMEEARAADLRLQKGDRVTPLTGVPIAVKDIFCTRGVLTTCGSKILENFKPPYDATVVARLKEAGSVTLGKTNMDEFAMGSSNETSHYGIVHNPWDLEKIPGGSSGGSAAAVAAGQCFGALGTDTGGSIRQPASLCGIVGIKPTYGRVSRYGMIAFASSLDQGGPLGREVQDCALMLQVMVGHDPKDSTSVPMPVPNYLEHIQKGVKSLRVGVPQEYFVEGINPEVEKAVRKAIQTLKELGAEIIEVSLPHTSYATAVYYIIAPSEASSNLARYDGVEYGFRSSGAKNLLEMYRKTRSLGFGEEVKRRIMIGTYALSSGYYDAYYRKAQQVRTLIRRDFDRAFEKCDLIVTPTSPTPAFGIGEKASDPIQMYLSDIFTISCNLAGLPGISVPCGFNTQGLPLGLQLLGRPFDEERLFQVAHAFEQVTDWHKKRPEILSS